MDKAEHQRLQERLNRLETSLIRLLNHLPGLAYRCEVEGADSYDYRMIFVSKGCERLLGVSQDEITNEPTNIIEGMTLEEDLAGLRTALHQAIHEHRSYEIYYRLRTPTDEIKWVWDQGEGVYDEEGKCIYLEGIMMDVTAQKNKELRLKKENRKLRFPEPNTHGLGRIVGNSYAMQEVYDLILKAAKSDTNVIIYGETGVGKDLVAETIYDLSNTKGSFIPVNCGAIPEQLLESEFFGHVKGAFSGATSNRDGYLAAADGGTLFLDEIAELPLNLQVKLLRALESRTYTPVGSNEHKVSRFRLISATNRDLKGMVNRGEMRADFFYRVHVLVINVPPLRDRKEDIPLLIGAYARHRGLDGVIPPHVLQWLQAYNWPGNVRELQNTLERYWVFDDLETDALLLRETQEPSLFRRENRLSREPHLLDRDSTPPLSYPPHMNTRRVGDTSVGIDLSTAREESEKRQIIAMLEQQGWKKTQTAQALGITLRTLQRKLKKYGITRS